LRVEAVPRDAAIIEIREIFQHPLGVMAAVGTAHDERARGFLAVVLLYRLVHVEREFHEALARFVIRIFWLVLDRDSVPSLVARGEGIALRQRRRQKCPGAELRSGEAAGVDDDLSIP
jgi:hypothetical protein